MSKRSMPPPPTRQTAASGVSLKRQMSKAPVVKSPAKSPAKSQSWQPMTQPNPIGSPIEYLPPPISQSFDIDDDDSDFQERQVITESQALDPGPTPLEDEENYHSDSDEPEVTIVKSDGSVVPYRKPEQTASMVQEKKQYPVKVTKQIFDDGPDGLQGVIYATSDSGFCVATTRKYKTNKVLISKFHPHPKVENRWQPTYPGKGELWKSGFVALTVEDIKTIVKLGPTLLKDSEMLQELDDANFYANFAVAGTSKQQQQH